MSLEADVVVVRSRHGLQFGFSEDLVMRQTVEFGAHTRPEIALVCAQVPKGGLVIDVGAHLGSFTVPLCRAVGPTGRIIAFEPNPEVADLLELNLVANGVAHVADVHRCAVSDSTSDYVLRTENRRNTGSTYLEPVDDGGAVRSVRLDDLLQDGGLPQVDLLKIDVEGMELAVLRGAAGIVERFRPILYLEINSSALARFGHERASVATWLGDRGYSTYRNVLDRNARSDAYELAAADLAVQPDEMFDVLAVPGELV